MIRFIGVAAFVILFLILSIPLMLIEWIIGKTNPSRKAVGSLRIVQWAFRVCLKIAGVRTTLLGAEHLPEDGSALFVLNHRSQFDVLLTYTQMRRPAGFIAKKELGRIPLLNVWMRNLYCLFLDRRNPKEGARSISTAITYMNQGISILICPEGTRSKTAQMLPFKEGSFKIAIKSKRPIIPVALSNTSAIFEDQFPRIRKAHVVIEFGAPIDPASFTKEEQKQLGALTQQRIQEMLDKNAALV